MVTPDSRPVAEPATASTAPADAPSATAASSHRSRGAEKTARIPIKVDSGAPALRKPDWIRVRLDNPPAVERLKNTLRAHRLHTVCEEASCPNLPECFGHGTATFMIMGDICTRRCPFCDVAHGRPGPLNADEPVQLASTIREMRLRYVVITSVDRDDLRDGGAGHFAACIREIRARCPGITVEVLVPDFRGRMEAALAAFSVTPPDVFNHNLETVPRLYRQARPGADYAWSLDLLRRVKASHPEVPTKSGLMVGLGESIEEIERVMRDLRAHDVNMLTIGQYLRPSPHHLPVARYVPPDEFARLRQIGEAMGFSHVASGPLVRSSYHADRQARTVLGR